MKKIQDQAVGRWKSILEAIGIDKSYLTGEHGPCPLCKEGKDRFRFDDLEGNGTWICSKCGAGNGVDLVMKFLKVDFGEARKIILSHLPDSVVEIAKAKPKCDPQRGVAMWGRAAPLNGYDPASKYLIDRGLFMKEWPTQIRYLSNCPYWHQDKTKTMHDAMIAQYVSPDAEQRTYHLTYLTPDGRKADVPVGRKLLPGPIPRGGAVRLARSSETLGVAEGIETAMSAMWLDNLPVWACLTAGGVMKFEPPKSAKHIIVYGDNDKSFTGHHAAYSLAYRLQADGFDVTVRIPDEVGIDWNDFVVAENPPLLEAAE